jgi:cytochrome oxidase Cu insertion factor (SCO1/SenC/PrrC family)
MQWILCGTALLGILGLALRSFRRLPRRPDGRESIVAVLSLCFIMASLVTSTAVAILDRLNNASKASLGNTQMLITAPVNNAPASPVETLATDFTLPRLDNGAPVHLAALLRRRPVALVFGSFGCLYFCSRLANLRQLQEKYGDKIDFLFVYINNGHPEPDALQAVRADKDAAPDAPVNRLARIRAGMELFGVSMPCVVDAADDRVQKAYGAFPARLVIVDRTSKVAFDSGSILSSGLNPEGAAAWLELHTRPTKTP